MPSKDLILQIHKKNHKAVLAITGGGTEAVGELLRYGNGSNTLLEAVIPYDQKAFNDFVKGRPDKYCAPEAARDLAMAAYLRSQALSPGELNIGLGVTCSLAKDNERPGREHKAYIAVQTIFSTTTYHLENAQLVGDRESQEKIVAEEIIRALAYTKGIIDHPNAYPHVATQEEFKLIHGRIPACTFDPINKIYRPNGHAGRKTIFPGSFNPFHAGHDEMARVASELTWEVTDLEICVKNVDKPAVNYTDLNLRLTNCVQAVAQKPWTGLIHLTSTPTFVEKAKLFPSAVFVVGFDTLKRIGDAKYGNPQETVRILKEYNTRFLAFHRIINGEITREQDIFPPLMDLVMVAPPEKYTPSEISSSSIRQNK